MTTIPQNIDVSNNILGDTLDDIAKQLEEANSLVRSLSGASGINWTTFNKPLGLVDAETAQALLRSRRALMEAQVLMRKRLASAQLDMLRWLTAEADWRING